MERIVSFELLLLLADDCDQVRTAGLRGLEPISKDNGFLRQSSAVSPNLDRLFTRVDEVIAAADAVIPTTGTTRKAQEVLAAVSQSLTRSEENPQPDARFALMGP